MKHIHIVGAGGPAGVGLARCLRDRFELTGSDESQWGRLMMECPVRLKLPEADLYLPVPDSAVYKYAGLAQTFLPAIKQVDLCQDKAKTASLLGDLAPTVYWVRDTEGAGGKGAQMASELLPGRNYSAEFVFFMGKELASFQKERLSYQVKEKTEGVDNRGSSAVSVCTNRPEIWHTARQALDRLKDHTGTALHGFYGVDLKENGQALPKVTEINAGRLLTASYSYYWLTGYNLPLLGAQAVLGEDRSPLPDYPEGWGMVRQTDQLPKICPPAITKEWR